MPNPDALEHPTVFDERLVILRRYHPRGAPPSSVAYCKTRPRQRTAAVYEMDRIHLRKYWRWVEYWVVDFDAGTVERLSRWERSEVDQMRSIIRPTEEADNGKTEQRQVDET